MRGVGDFYGRTAEGRDGGMTAPAVGAPGAPGRGHPDDSTGPAALAGLHHAALSVGDIDAAVGWYREVLGLEETFRRESGTQTVVVMRFPGLAATLGLVEHRGGGHGFSPANLGLDHLAFAVRSGEELWAWARRLQARGVACSDPTETPFGGMLHFTDPDGIALALFWERPPAASGRLDDGEAPGP